MKENNSIEKVSCTVKLTADMLKELLCIAEANDCPIGIYVFRGRDYLSYEVSYYMLIAHQESGEIIDWNCIGSCDYNKSIVVQTIKKYGALPKDNMSEIPTAKIYRTYSQNQNICVKVNDNSEFQLKPSTIKIDKIIEHILSNLDGDEICYDIVEGHIAAPKSSVKKIFEHTYKDLNFNDTLCQMAMLEKIIINNGKKYPMYRLPASSDKKTKAYIVFGKIKEVGNDK